MSSAKSGSFRLNTEVVDGGGSVGPLVSVHS